MPKAETAWAKLAERFPDKDIRWRPQSVVDKDFKSQKGVKPGQYPDGCKAKFLAYIDARNVMDRLDKVVGPESWADTYRPIEHDARSRVLAVECALTVNGVTKVDVGYRNAPGNDSEDEPAKAAYSDAFKRAAVKFGIGRFLYDMGDSGWVAVDKWGKPKQKLGNGKVDAPQTETAARDFRTEVETLGKLAAENKTSEAFKAKLGNPADMGALVEAYCDMSEPERDNLERIAQGQA